MRASPRAARVLQAIQAVHDSEPVQQVSKRPRVRRECPWLSFGGAWQTNIQPYALAAALDLGQNTLR